MKKRITPLLLAVLLPFLPACGEPGPEARSEAEGLELAGGPELQVVDHAQLREEIQSRDAAVKLVNFWATWCMPCVEEFPDLVRIGKEFDAKGVDLLFVSADYETLLPRARAFLEDHGVTWTTYRQDWDDTDFVHGFHDRWSGALPATFLFDEKGELVDFWEGKASYEELRERIDRALDA